MFIFHLFVDSYEIFRQKSKNLLAIILLIEKISSNRCLWKKLVWFFDAVKSWLFGCFLRVFRAAISIQDPTFRVTFKPFELLVLNSKRSSKLLVKDKFWTGLVFPVQISTFSPRISKPQVPETRHTTWWAIYCHGQWPFRGTIFRTESAFCVHSLSVYLKILRSFHFDKLEFKITSNKTVKIEKEGSAI